SIGYREPCAAWKIGVHDDEVVAHLDDDVVAMTLALEVSFAEPHPRHDLLDRAGLRARAGDEQRQQRESGKPCCDARANGSHKPSGRSPSVLSLCREFHSSLCAATAPQT